jgi:hypothetical protein
MPGHIGTHFRRFGGGFLLLTTGKQQHHKRKADKGKNKGFHKEVE